MTPVVRVKTTRLQDIGLANHRSGDFLTLFAVLGSVDGWLSFDVAWLRVFSFVSQRAWLQKV